LICFSVEIVSFGDITTSGVTVSESHQSDIDSFMQQIECRNPNEPEFHQAVREVAQDIVPFIADKDDMQNSRVLDRLSEPDRILSFRVVWEDDQGQLQINRGYRVQHNNAIGPYKGGIRFHPSVNQSVLKFLAFEQVFKNALTGLPLGGAKGGADFDPQGRSDSEVMRFCHAFMTEMHRHIGPDCDVPAGDIGVGVREVGFLFGQYKRLSTRFEGAITGKPLELGGSKMRAAATGYGTVYMMEQVLAHQGGDLSGKRCLVSGAGNVALYCAEKLLDQGADVVTLSDSGGTIYHKDGLTPEQLEWIFELKTERRGSLDEAAEEFAFEYLESQAPWQCEGDLAFPCATQNEIDDEAAKQMLANGVRAVSEGANMPTTRAAIEVFRSDENFLHVPSKAANAGGVAVSGLEMSQNSQRLGWSETEVDDRLREIMEQIHSLCLEFGQQKGAKVDYCKGANIAAFTRVASAMMAHGAM
jgi:glutamate dehydrogenase (NADP+)